MQVIKDLWWLHLENHPPCIPSAWSQISEGTLPVTALFLCYQNKVLWRKGSWEGRRAWNFLSSALAQCCCFLASKAFTFSDSFVVSQERCLLGKNGSGRLGPPLPSNSEGFFDSLIVGRIGPFPWTVLSEEPWTGTWVWFVPQDAAAADHTPGGEERLRVSEEACVLCLLSMALSTLFSRLGFSSLG